VGTMETNTIPLRRIGSTIKVCPVCSGDKAVVNPFEQQYETACYLCGGTGTVDTKAVCTCGRPLIWEYKGFKVCNAQVCWQEVDDFVEKASKTASTTTIAADWDEEQWRNFYGCC